MNSVLFDINKKLSIRFMLSTLLSSQQHHFDALAKVWLDNGATHVSLCQNGTILAQWPDVCRLPKNGLAMPINVNGEKLAEFWVTGVDNSQQQTQLQTDVNLIAHIISLEEELDILTAELIDNQDQLLALYNLTKSTRSHLEIDQALRVLAQETKRLVKAEGVFILLKNPDQIWSITQIPSDCLNEDIMDYIVSQVDSDNNERLLNVKDIPFSLSKNGTSLFLKRIPIRDQTIAILGVLFSQPTASISPHLKLTRAISDYIGSQLENALLHQDILEQAKLKTEVELAARIQLQLMPRRPPQISGLDLSAGSRPAFHVGGDFFDFVAQPGWPFTFVVGDVSGKGMPAALLMAMSRSVIRSKAGVLPTPTPELVLGYSNEVLYEDFTEVAMFATVFVGQYNPQKHELTYANAGHSPVIFCPVDGPARMLEADGPAMGVMPLSLSEDFSIPFNSGDVLVVATDGFSEARNVAGEMFGYTRLLKLIEQVAHLSANDIADTLFNDITDFGSNRPQDDDQTLIVIKGTET